MNNESRPPAEARRAQILTAAAQCFRRDGFHGASIAQISQLAGMSSGHIYHYFDNKEAIIAAIVGRDLERLLGLTAELRAAADVGGALVNRVAEGVANNLDPEQAGLKLEIVAEAARNPRVAEIVRQADATCRASLVETIRDVRQALGHTDDEEVLAGMVEVIAALFEGLLIRRVRNPSLAPELLVRIFQATLRNLMGLTLTGGADHPGVDGAG